MGRLRLLAPHRSPQQEAGMFDVMEEEEQNRLRYRVGPEGEMDLEDEPFQVLEPESLSDELRARRHPEDEPPLTGVEAEIMRGEIARTGAATDTEVEEVAAYSIARILNPRLPALRTGLYDQPTAPTALEEVGAEPRVEQPPEFEPELRFGPPPPKREPESFRRLERGFGERRTVAAAQGPWGSPGRSAPAFAPEPPPSFGITAIGPGVHRGIALGPVGVTTGITIPTWGLSWPLEQELRRRGAYGR